MHIAQLLECQLLNPPVGDRIRIKINKLDKLYAGWGGRAHMSVSASCRIQTYVTSDTSSCVEKIPVNELSNIAKGNTCWIFIFE